MPNPSRPGLTASVLSQNRILAAASPDERRRLMPHAALTAVPWKRTVQRVREPVRHVFFPIRGVFSVTTALPDGAIVESATVGPEGMLGIEAYLSADAIASGDTMLQVPEGRAIRVDTHAFRIELAKGGRLATVVGAYVQLMLQQMMQAAACNARHSVRERGAKWLLLTHDRIGTDAFKLSHEFLSMMIAATRPTVTVIARQLQHEGLITYSYGVVVVRDRVGLEQAACSCYRLLRSSARKPGLLSGTRGRPKH